MTATDPPASAGEGRLFGRVFVLAEAAELRRGRVLRPTGVLVGFAWLALTGAVLTGAAPLSTRPGWWAAVAVAAVTLVASVVLVAGWSAAAESRLFRRAPHRWLVHTARGAGGAYVRADRCGGWTVHSVCAHPQGVGIGTEVMRRVCDDADRRHQRLRLTAVTARAATFYTRFGFQATGRNLLGTAMTRPPC